MSKNTTTPEFEIGDEVLIFADDDGFYLAEKSDTPLLRGASIISNLDEDGDYEIEAPSDEDRNLGWYAREARVFPLGTILVDGKPVRPEDQDANRELPEDHSFHSDGGVFYSATAGTSLPDDLGNPSNEWIPLGTIDADSMDFSGGFSLDAGATMTFKLIDMDHEAMRLYFGSNEGGGDYDPYQEFLDDASDVLDSRGEDYGGVEDNFADIAALWSVITGVEIRAEQVGLMMIALKLVRANKTNKRDNLLDIVGYAAHVAKIQEGLVDKA